MRPSSARALALAAILTIVLGPAAVAQSPTALKLTLQQQERLGIRVEPVRKAEAVAVVDLVGRAVRAPSSLRTVLAPFSGTVVKVHVLPGENVKAGDPIATIMSRDYATAASALSQAHAEAAVAEAALARQKQLVSLGLAPKSTAGEAKARVERAQAQVREGAWAARASGASGQAGAYIVRAPASGRIGNLQAHAGDPVDGFAPLTTMATTKSLWVEFQVPARLIRQIAAGDGVTFSNGDMTSLSSVSDVVDPQTRSAIAVAEAPAALDLFEGQILKAQVSQRTLATKLVEAPARAIVQIDGLDHVFRRTTDGFQPTPVEVVGRTAEAATIGGLRSDDVIAASGLTELKSMAMQGNR